MFKISYAHWLIKSLTKFFMENSAEKLFFSTVNRLTIAMVFYDFHAIWRIALFFFINPFIPGLSYYAICFIPNSHETSFIAVNNTFKSEKEKLNCIVSVLFGSLMAICVIVSHLSCDMLDSEPISNQPEKKKKHTGTPQDILLLFSPSFCALRNTISWTFMIHGNL